MHRSARRPATFRLRSVLTAASAAAVLVLAACGSGDESSSEPEESGGTETTSVTIGLIPIIDVAPIFVGIDQGFFADQGLDLTTEMAQGGAAIVPGVVSGQYQFGFSNTISLLLGADKGLPIKVVGPGVASTGESGADFGSVLVPEDSDVQGAADLAGKKVAVNTLNNINTVTINKIVADAGGDPSTIEYVELPFPEIVPAIAAGDVDAGQVVEPFQTIGEGQGLRQVASNYADTAADLPVALYFTSTEYMSENPEVVEGFTAALLQSMEYAQANPDAARAILSEYTSLEPDLQSEVVLPQWPSEISTDSVTLLAELSVSDGLLTEQPDLTALLP